MKRPSSRWNRKAKPWDDEVEAVLSDDHYTRYRRPGAPAAAAKAKTTPPRPCPEPGEFTIDEEIYWLLVTAQQVGWPFPATIRRQIEADRMNRFTIDQLRFLLRKEPRISVLDMAIAGVLLFNLNAVSAAYHLRALQAGALSIAHHSAFGAWPPLTKDAELSWDTSRQALYQPEAADLDSPTMKLAWQTLLLAQCGWPMPAAITRRFPKYWVRRKTPVALVAAIFSGRKGMTVADAVLAGAEVQGLSRAMLISAVARMVSAPEDAAGSPSDDPYGHLCSFFSEEDRDGLDEELLCFLAVKMRDILTGGDQNKGQRLSFTDFLFWQREGTNPLDNPSLQLRASREQPNEEDDSPETLASGASAAEDQGAPDGEADPPSQPAATPAPETSREQETKGEDSADKGSPAHKPPASQTTDASAEGQSPTAVGIPGSDSIEILGPQAVNDLIDRAVLYSRLGLDLDDEQRAALPSDFEQRVLSPYRIAELMPPRRPTFLDAAWKIFGHEVPPIEGKLRDLLERQVATLRSDLIADINQRAWLQAHKFKDIYRFNRSWLYDYMFYIRGLKNSFIDGIYDEKKPFTNFEYLIEAHDSTYNAQSLNMIELMDCIIYYINNENLFNGDIRSHFYEMSESSDFFLQFYKTIDFNQHRDDVINSMIELWKSIESNYETNFIRSVKRE